MKKGTWYIRLINGITVTFHDDLKAYEFICKAQESLSIFSADYKVLRTR